MAYFRLAASEQPTMMLYWKPQFSEPCSYKIVSRSIAIQQYSSNRLIFVIEDIQNLSFITPSGNADYKLRNSEEGYEEE
jgi:hypothetical protein